MGYLRYVRQATGAVCVSFSALSMALTFAWPSGTISLFSSDETVLNRPMTPTEQALFGSLSSIGAMISTPLTGFLLDKIGRRSTSIVLSLFQVLAWTLISTCSQVEVILTAMALSGVSGGVFLTATMYIGEICEESIRGSMAVTAIVQYCIGLLLSYVIGGFMSYEKMVYTCLSLSIIGVLTLLAAKESPIYLMQNNRTTEATEVIAFYRAKNTLDKEVQEEINTIKRSLNPDMDDDTDGVTEKFLQNGETSAAPKLSAYQFFMKSRSTRRAFLVCMVLMTCAIFQGLVVVQVYAEPLFKAAVPTISPLTMCVVFALVTLCSSVGAGYLAEIAGRKSLMVYSSTASGACCVLLGTQIQLEWAPGIVTALLINLFCVTFTLGPGTIPYVVTAEVFLPEVRSMTSALVFEWAWICSFVILLIFNPLVDKLGLGPLFYIFSAVCFATAVFCYFFQPETKGLPVDKIQSLFVTKKRIRVEKA